MAVLTPDQLTAIRQACETLMPEIDYKVADIDAAIQAVEDNWESTIPGYTGAINAATAPFMFTAAQKVIIIEAWKGNT